MKVKEKRKKSLKIISDLTSAKKRKVIKSNLSIRKIKAGAGQAKKKKENHTIFSFPVLTFNWAFVG